ncbi:MAG: MFS transporter [Opitutales bacterium]
MSHERRNYWAFLLDGGLFVGGVSFVNAQTLLPGVILDEGGPAWLAAFVPSAMVVGLFSLPVLTARWIDGLRRLKPFVLKVGVMQRVVYLLAGLLLLTPGLGESGLIWIIALAPLFSGICGGVGFAGFQRFYISCVPPRMRASNVAYRFLFGGSTGVLAGLVIERLIAGLPLAKAMANLHFLAFGWMVLSWIALSTSREPPSEEDHTADEPEANPPVLPAKFDLFSGLRDLVASGPGRSRRLRFLTAVVFMHAFFFAVPFFAAYLQRSLGESKAFLGVLAMWSMGGNAVGNLLAAGVGDRFGARLPFLLGSLGIAIVMLVVPWVEGRTASCVVYAAFAVCVMLMVVGKDTLVMDFGPVKRQASYLAAMALVTMLSLLGASAIGFVLWELTDTFAVLAYTTAAGSLLCFWALKGIPEPRSDVQTSPLVRLRRGLLRYFR